MKVVHIDTEMTWRGGENQTRLLIEGLNKKGVENHLIGPRGSEIVNRLAKKAKVNPIPMRGGADVVAAYKIASYCRRYKIDIIDCQTANAHSLGLLVKRFYPPAKLVVHRRVDYPPKKNFLSKRKYMSKKVDCFVAISHSIAQILLNYGIEKEKIATVRSAVESLPYQNLDRNKARSKLLEQYSLAQETLLIGNASALTEQKGYDDLLYAMHELMHKNIKFHCFIAGDGHLRAFLESLAKQLNLSNQVTFLGLINNVAEFLAGLDILAMPSHFEGLGTLIQEGIYAGCCVVASDVGGIAEMIVHNETGLLSPKRDVKALVDNLVSAGSDQKMREKLNTKAQNYIKEFFNLQTMIDGNYEVYKKILGNSLS